MPLNLQVEYWSTNGETKVWINGKAYYYYADAAVIRRFVEMAKDSYQWGTALGYLKTFADSCEKVEFDESYIGSQKHNHKVT